MERGDDEVRRRGQQEGGRCQRRLVVWRRRQVQTRERYCNEPGTYLGGFFVTVVWIRRRLWLRWLLAGERLDGGVQRTKPMDAVVATYNDGC